MQKNSDQFEQRCGNCFWAKFYDLNADWICARTFEDRVQYADQCHNQDSFLSKEQAERCLHVLTEHNKWRRDEHVPNSLPMQDPKELGKALDFAVDVIKTFLEL